MFNEFHFPALYFSAGAFTFTELRFLLLIS